MCPKLAKMCLKLAQISLPHARMFISSESVEIIKPAFCKTGLTAIFSLFYILGKTKKNGFIFAKFVWRQKNMKSFRLLLFNAMIKTTKTTLPLGAIAPLSIEKTFLQQKTMKKPDAFHNKDHLSLLLLLYKILFVG